MRPVEFFLKILTLWQREHLFEESLTITDDYDQSKRDTQLAPKIVERNAAQDISIDISTCIEESAVSRERARDLARDGIECTFKSAKYRRVQSTVLRQIVVSSCRRTAASAFVDSSASPCAESDAISRRHCDRSRDHARPRSWRAILENESRAHSLSPRNSRNFQ